MAAMSRTAAGVIGRAALWTIAGLAVLIVSAPVLLAWWLSSPVPTPSAEDAGVTTGLRDIAYTLRNERVRDSVDRGADLAAVATVLGVPSMSPAHVRAEADPGAGQFVLIGVRAVGDSGVSIDLVQSAVPSGRSSGFFSREVRPWVGCYRVELPVLAIDAVTWTARDITCPTFSKALQHADRIHVDGVPERPLLRPPCYGTTGYCPGG
jgi:hypothetical protein